ncbi:hypothetical protein, partial [Peptostreptococcus anaerobius]|uniref:hypothetical protein n=1 Tax=Peptostreptococcus anaerobius TaxID=1261 RepID=UPI00321AC7FB
MIRFRRKVYEKLLEKLGQKVDLMKSSIVENCTELPEINSMTDVVEVLKSHHLKSGDFLEEVSNEILSNVGWYGNGLIAYKDKIYMIGLFSRTYDGDYVPYTDNVAEYDINLNKWNVSKKLKFKRTMGAFCVIENVVYYFSYQGKKLCTYNLDTESNIFTGIVDNTDSYGGALIMTPYKDNIYMIKYNSPNMIIYKIDLSTNTIYEYSKFKTDIYKIQACYDGNYIYFSDGIKIYRFDIETKTYELFFDFSPIASREAS